AFSYNLLNLKCRVRTRKCVIIEIKNMGVQGEFKDKVIVVTGGGGVLCRSFAKTLAAHGGKVAILDLNLGASEAVAEEIRKSGGEAIGVEADVLNAESLKKAHEKVKAAFGPCDILINGAGGNHPKGTTTKEFLLKEDLGKE